MSICKSIDNAAKMFDSELIIIMLKIIIALVNKLLAGNEHSILSSLP